MKINKNIIISRIYPAIICSLPILITNYFLLNNYLGDFFTAINNYQWASGITVSMVLIYLLSQAGRFIGKEIFEKIHFNNELNMPTTRMLLHSDNTYSSEKKKIIHSKIFRDFNINIYTYEQENNDESLARKLIIDCVSLIRAKMRDGHLIIQHNNEYGFIRNLVGNSTIAVFISILNLLLFGFIIKQPVVFYLSLFLSIFYLLIIYFGRKLIDKYGTNYAKILIQEYLIY